MHPAVRFVHDYHRDLSDFFAGRRPREEVWAALVAGTPDAMVLVYPSGRRLTGPQLLASIEGRYGASPDFLAVIEDAEVIRAADDHAVVAYREVQQQATQSRSSNRRSALALIEHDDASWRWRYIQETDEP